MDGSDTDVHPLSIGPDVVVSGKMRNELRRSLGIQLGCLQRCSLVVQGNTQCVMNGYQDTICALNTAQGRRQVC